jgi:HK97 family phage major capsid protein
LHARYRREIEIVRDETLPAATREKAQTRVVELRRQLDETMLGIVEARERDEENEARARAEEVAWGVTSAPPEQRDGTSVRERYQTWERAGKPGVFRLAVYPDVAADLRAAGNTRARVEFRHDEERPLIEGQDWTAFAERRTLRDLAKRTAILTTDAGTVYSSYLAPSRTDSSLAWHENHQSGIVRAGVTIIQTPDDVDLYLPEVATDAAAAHHDEGAQASETSPVLARTLLKSYRYDGYFSVTNEMLRSSVVDFVGELQNGANRALATSLAAAYATGSGSSLPQGLAGSTTTTLAGKTASTATSFTLDDLKALKNSVLPGYRQDASCAWVIGTNAWNLLDSLKDDNGQYFMTPSVVAGEPDRLLGKPIYEDAGLPDIATGEKGPVLFGAFAYFKIRHAGPVVFEASESFAFDRFQTTFRFAAWRDSSLALASSGPIKHLLMP